MYKFAVHFIEEPGSAGTGRLICHYVERFYMVASRMTFADAVRHKHPWGYLGHIEKLRVNILNLSNFSDVTHACSFYSIKFGYIYLFMYQSFIYSDPTGFLRHIPLGSLLHFPSMILRWQCGMLMSLEEVCFLSLDGKTHFGITVI